jgi:hypothetical protein
MLRRFVPVVALALAAAPRAAQAKAAPAAAGLPKPGFNWVVEGNVAFGGEELIELQFQNGDTQKLTAGQGGQIAFGAQYRLPAAPRLAIGAVLGYKFVTNASENASIGITRIPVEVIGRYSFDADWWVGAGITKHNSVNMNGDGFFPDTELESNAAPTLQLGWKYGVLSYTAMEYTAPGGQTFDASAIGIGFRWVIGQR